jgi:hypothetical protein
LEGLTCLWEYCNSLKLTVNIAKTKIVPFHRAGLRKKESFYFNNTKIEIVNKYRYLGIDFSASGRFMSHAQSAINKVRGVGEATIGILRKARSDTWESKLKLYDSVVLPTLLYGSEVWALSCLEVVERGQLGFFKRLFLLSNTTPSWALRLEVGRRKVSHTIFKSSLAWLKKILEMPSNRYPRICFDKLYELSLSDEVRVHRKLNWVNLLKEQFRIAGFENVWTHRSTLWNCVQAERGIVIKLHADALVTVDMQAAINSANCPLYRILNQSFEMGEQLTIRMPFEKVRVVSQLRMATNRSLYLFVNRKGTKIDCSGTCPLCNLQNNETLKHILLVCPMYADLRKRFLSRYLDNVITEENKLTVLLSNLSISKVNILYIFIYKAMQIRDLIYGET